MTTKTWFGGVGRYGEAANWQPTGVPTAGDAAFVPTGTVQLSNAVVSGVTVGLEGTSRATEPTLALRNVLFSADLDVGDPSEITGFAYGRVTVTGIAITTGGIFDGTARGPAIGRLEIDIARGSALLNTGPIQVPIGSQMTINSNHGAGIFIQYGTVFDGGFVTVDAPVTGSGTFALGYEPDAESSLEFGSIVDRGTTVSLGPAPASLAIDKPAQFLGGVTGFGSGDSLALPNTIVTSETFKDNELSLFDGKSLVGKLNIIGDFSTASFMLSAGSRGGTVIELAHPTAAGSFSVPDQNTSLVSLTTYPTS